MKKILLIIILIIVSGMIIFFNFLKKDFTTVQTYYNIYLHGNHIGTVDSIQKLIKYIDDKQQDIKDKYSVQSVNFPNELDFQKVITYDQRLDSVEYIYNEISKNSSFTIDGYQITISNSYGSSQIYVTDYSIFEKSVENLIETYIGSENYKAYKNNNQKTIENVGTYINDIYLSDDITVKSLSIAVYEKIYSNVEELTKFLLYGVEGQEKKYITAIGDTIEQIAFKNKISVEEFMIANPSFNNSNLLLYPGQEVIIGITDPQLEVTIEQTVIEDTDYQYKTIETIDEEKVIGTLVVLQEGENGLLRVQQNKKYINGNVVYVEPISKEVLKQPIDRVIIKGGKKVSGVGSLTDWAWPTESGWVITDPYGWRINPIDGSRELHGALDIAGPGHGSAIYAANNGIITAKGNHYMSGNYIYIDHNNGYSTEYCHMSGFANVVIGQAVEKGQIIGYMGMTGWATGPHLHYAVWKGSRPWAGGTRINPFLLY